MTEQETFSWKILLLVAFIAATTGYAIYSLISKTGSGVVLPEQPLSLVGSMRPGFTLPDLQGEPRHIKEWDGKVILINFWATWCPPCRREMPGFIELREQYAGQGFEIIGIAIDKVEAVREYVASLGVNYPVLHGQDDASVVSHYYGNGPGMLPYSVMIDRDGKIVFARAGELHKKDLEKELLQLL